MKESKKELTQKEENPVSNPAISDQDLKAALIKKQSIRIDERIANSEFEKAMVNAVNKLLEVNNIR